MVDDVGFVEQRVEIEQEPVEVRQQLRPARGERLERGRVGGQAREGGLIVAVDLDPVGEHTRLLGCWVVGCWVVGCWVVGCWVVGCWLPTGSAAHSERNNPTTQQPTTR